MNTPDLLVMGLTSFLFVISFNFKILVQTQIKTYLALLVLTIFNFLVTNVLVKTPESNSVWALSIPLLSILIGYKVSLTQKQVNILLGLFSILILVLGFVQISTNID